MTPPRAPADAARRPDPPPKPVAPDDWELTAEADRAAGLRRHHRWRTGELVVTRGPSGPPR